MSKVSHFQVYSQRENHVTNNTLLVLRHFYQASPFKLERVLNSLLDEDFKIGLSFEQQVRGDKSVLDARILQPSLLIGVETKLYDNLWSDQIRRHIDSIATSREAGAPATFLVALTKEPAPTIDLKQMEIYAKGKAITFKTVTFSQIIESLREACAEYEQNLISILEDYESFVESQGLLDDRGKRIVVFPCGTSYKENEKFCLYYEGPERPSKRGCKFIGIYRSKIVSLVGEISSILTCKLANEHLELIEVELGRATDDQQKRIYEVIKTTNYYDLSGPQRYYLADEFYETKLQKTSKGGLWGYKYLNIPEIVGSSVKTGDITAKDLAAGLMNRTFD